MPLLPESYKEISPKVYYPAICPKCTKEVSGPYKTGRSIVGVHQAVYRCANCKLSFSIRYDPKNPKNQFLIDYSDAGDLAERPPCTLRYLLHDKARQERPASAVLPALPGNSDDLDNQD